MKAWMLLALLLPVAPMLTSCGDKDAVVEKPQNQSAAVQALINEANALNYSISTNSLLRSNAERDKTSMVTLIQRVRIAAMKLSLNPQDKVALQMLIDSSNEYKTIQVINTEKPQFDKFFQLVSEVIAETTGQIGGTYNLSSATLFSYTFSSGLEPFATKAKGEAWSTRSSLDVFFTSVRGTGNKAWLVAPLMDLSKVMNPRLQLRHATQVEPDNGPTPAPGKIYKIKVSTSFKGGNPNKAKWEDVELKTYPTGLNFHTVDTEEIDLSKYQGKEVAIALVYDTTDKSIPRGRYGWSVYRFQVLGAGSVSNLKVMSLKEIDNNTYVYKRDFEAKEDQSFKGLTQSSNTEDKKAFAVKVRNAKHYIEIGGRVSRENPVPKIKAGDYFLTTDEIDLSNVNGSSKVGISMRHSLSFCNNGKCDPKDALQLQVSESGADSWEVIDFKDDNFPENGMVFTDVVSGSNGSVFIPSSYNGKKVQLRVKFKQIENSTHVWQFKDLKLKIVEGK